MSIPTAFDHELGAIDSAASSITIHLRTMQHAAARDLPRLREQLRQKLQNFVDDVMATARDNDAT